MCARVKAIKKRRDPYREPMSSWQNVYWNTDIRLTVIPFTKNSLQDKLVVEKKCICAFLDLPQYKLAVSLHKHCLSSPSPPPPQQSWTLVEKRAGNLARLPSSLFPRGVWRFYLQSLWFQLIKIIIIITEYFDSTRSLPRNFFSSEALGLWSPKKPGKMQNVFPARELYNSNPW